MVEVGQPPVVPEGAGDVLLGAREVARPGQEDRVAARGARVLRVLPQAGLRDPPGLVVAAEVGEGGQPLVVQGLLRQLVEGRQRALVPLLEQVDHADPVQRSQFVGAEALGGGQLGQRLLEEADVHVQPAEPPAGVHQARVEGEGPAEVGGRALVGEAVRQGPGQAPPGGVGLGEAGVEGERSLDRDPGLLLPLLARLHQEE